MSRILLLCLFWLSINSYESYGQQDFKTNYNFKRALDTKRFILQRYDTSLKKYVSINPDNGSLKGVIKSISQYHDSIKIAFWPWPAELKDESGNTLTYKDYKKQFLLIVKDWPIQTVKRLPKFKNYSFKAFDVPFNSKQLFAMNIPLRYNLKDGSFSSEFINANVSYSWIHGRTRIYESEFIEPRTRYWGYGLFTGFGNSKDKNDNDIAGINYGANFIFTLYNFNFLITGGGESGLSKNGKTKAYLGLGIGFDLFKIMNGGYSNGKE